jgi:hypothetical protein
MPTRVSPLESETPFTPLVFRPMGRASASLKRMAMPLAVERTISSPVLVIAQSMSSSSSLSLMAMMPLLSGRLYALSSVFFTRPLRVAIMR